MDPRANSYPKKWRDMAKAMERAALDLGLSGNIVRGDGEELVAKRAVEVRFLRGLRVESGWGRIMTVGVIFGV